MRRLFLLSIVGGGAAACSREAYQIRIPFVPTSVALVFGIENPIYPVGHVYFGKESLIHLVLRAESIACALDTLLVYLHRFSIGMPG